MSRDYSWKYYRDRNGRFHKTKALGNGKSLWVSYNRTAIGSDEFRYPNGFDNKFVRDGVRNYTQISKDDWAILLLTGQIKDE